jgi:hypothetical protein
MTEHSLKILTLSIWGIALGSSLSAEEMVDQFSFPGGPTSIGADLSEDDEKGRNPMHQRVPALRILFERFDGDLFSDPFRTEYQPILPLPSRPFPPPLFHNLSIAMQRMDTCKEFHRQTSLCGAIV